MVSYSYQESQGEENLAEVIKGNINRLMMSLPRTMREPDDETKVVAMQLLYNHLRLMGSRVNSLLRTPSLLSRLSFTLFQILEFEVYRCIS